MGFARNPSLKPIYGGVLNCNVSTSDHGKLKHQKFGCLEYKSSIKIQLSSQKRSQCDHKDQFEKRNKIK